MSVAIPYRTNSQTASAASPVMSVLGLAFVGILIAQTTRILYMDANSVQSEQTDLAGYFLNAIIGVPLLYYGLQQRLLRFKVLIAIGIFTFLLTLNINRSSNGDLFSVLFSRYGIVVIFLLGVWSALALHAIRTAINSGLTRWFANLVSFSLHMFLLPVAFIVFNYLENRVATESYQQVSSNAIILICVSLLTVAAAKKPGLVANNLASYILLILCTFLVYAIALMQSTSIVAFWMVIFPVSLLSMTDSNTKIVRVLIAIGTGLIVYWLVIAFLLGDLLEDTRLGAINDGVLEISSVQSRLSLLSGFTDQFAVSPLFGAFDAELRAGYFAGNYMHSIVLSLLTHMGIIGTMLIAMVVYFIWKDGRTTGEFRQSFGRFYYRLFLAIILLGTLFTFFTWMPFWFFLGSMSVRMVNEGTARASLQ
jgi:hypothetical protein